MNIDILNPIAVSLSFSTSILTNHFPYNMELNDIYLFENTHLFEKISFLLKEFQFVIKFKTWWSMAYTVIHALLPMIC